jgi:hypothetical protein
MSGDAVCGLNRAREDEKRRFLGWASKPRSTVWPQNHWNGFSQFGLKTGGDGFSLFDIKTGGDGFSRFGLKIGGDGFSRFGLKTGGYGFSRFGLKIGSYNFVIWALKSPRRFLGFSLKTKRAAVCRLHHKTDRRMKTAWGKCRDLAAWFLKTTGTICQWFGLKTSETISPGLASKSVVTVPLNLASNSVVTVCPGLSSKSVATVSPALTSKSVAQVWWFGHQNHRDGFLVWASKSSELWFVGCATKPTEWW